MASFPAFHGSGDRGIDAVESYGYTVQRYMRLNSGGVYKDAALGGADCTPTVSATFSPSVPFPVRSMKVRLHNLYRGTQTSSLRGIRIRGLPVGQSEVLCVTDQTTTVGEREWEFPQPQILQGHPLEVELVQLVPATTVWQGAININYVTQTLTPTGEPTRSNFMYTGNPIPKVGTWSSATEAFIADPAAVTEIFFAAEITFFR